MKIERQNGAKIEKQWGERWAQKMEKQQQQAESETGRGAERHHVQSYTADVKDPSDREMT